MHLIKAKLLIISIGIAGLLQGQDSVRHRILFIGDAGEIDKAQETIIPAAAGLILAGKTTVMYLGDNIYPTGMGLPGSKEETATQNILRSQFAPMRHGGASVYFIPGNHDWDRMGNKGLAKIKSQWKYLEQQQDSLLKMLPPNGCPGPAEINITDSLVIITFDSEWWLFLHNKENAEADCDCNTKEEVLARLEELVYKNRYKTILLATHHPFQSYGHHGGYYSIMDHLFPFTAINKNILIPLPVAGSLYPLLRSLFLSPEDMKHPLYKDMIKKVDGVFAGFPNLVHVAGHEHGLQFIKDKQVQIISGAGAKQAYTRKGKNALYSATLPGFVSMDILPGNTVRINYYAFKEGKTSIVFTYDFAYTNTDQKDTAVHSAIHSDSIMVRPHPSYDHVNGLHRYIFGENYRKEYAAVTKVPTIQLSQFNGGLTPIKRGGGHQSRSLRLLDKEGKEWVMRSVEKYPEVLLPEVLRETFAKDLLSDNMSSQHPFGALVVPAIAETVDVPHASPVIGWVAPDKKLGMYAKYFANTLVLVEQREPAGKSDNTEKMLRQLTADNDNSVDVAEYMRAVMLDLLIGDWDRHPDQWRWHPVKKDKGKLYQAVPRDRDQVFFVMDGLIPKFASKPWLLPFLQGYGSRIKNINDYLWESRIVNNRLLTAIPQEQWKQVSRQFTAAVTDSVIETAISKLPEPGYSFRKDKLIQQMKDRRNNLATEMDKYYRFLNSKVDIQASDKNEIIEIKSLPDNGLSIHINKKNKEGLIKEVLYNKTFYPGITKEINIYTGKGNDSLVLDNSSPGIKLRLIGGEGSKIYNIKSSGKKVILYGNTNDAVYLDANNRLRKHLSNNSVNTAFIPTDLYDKTIPVIIPGYNYDDGVMLGMMVRHIHKGFRKLPYANVQQISFQHSFLTTAFNFKYKGEWTRALGKADLLLNANVFAPDNTQNFFGRGNGTAYDKIGDFRNYYRTRYGLFQLKAAARWTKNKNSFYIGPAIEMYTFDMKDNVGKFINQVSLLHSYDSNRIDKTKLFAGIQASFLIDTRNNSLLPAWGNYVNVRFLSGTGLNSYSRTFVQVLPEVTAYKSIGNDQQLVISNRLGGGVTIGQTAFYQSLFLGGQDNLLGYRQFRFAGQHMMYNNLETRIKIATINGYILPGQLGLIGFYDIGKVWEHHYNSNSWHQGAGGGIYFAPALMTVIKFVVGKSTEGWYPYLNLGMRF